MTKAKNKAATEAEVATENTTAASSTSPLDAAAGSQLIVTSGVQQGVSAAEGSSTPGTSDVGNDQAAALSVGESSNVLEQAAVTRPANEQELQDAVEKGSLAYPAGNTQPEREMMAAIRGFSAAFKFRYKHLLNGMANSTAEALRCLADAEIHLADHIAQQDKPKVGA